MNISIEKFFELILKKNFIITDKEILKQIHCKISETLIECKNSDYKDSYYQDINYKNLKNKDLENKESKYKDILDENKINNIFELNIILKDLKFKNKEIDEFILSDIFLILLRIYVELSLLKQ